MKPTIMILGSGHLANPGADAYNFKMDDVLAPKRQNEIKQLVDQLKVFRPTKVALEVDERFNTEIQEEYQNYLNGSHELKRNEGEQIGFRLAKQMGHQKLYCVDYWPEKNPFLPNDLDPDLMDEDKFAKEHNQEHLQASVEDFYPDGEVEFHKEENGRVWIVPTKYQPIIDMYINGNKPDRMRAQHQLCLRSARIGLKDQYPAANWLSHYWYDRNLKIFVNLTRITESPDDRIFLLIGGGHVYLVQQFLEDSGDYIVESPLKYLKNGEYSLMKSQIIFGIVLLTTLSLISITNLQTAHAQEIQTVKKELPAIKTEQPPTIDGILNDACWQDSPQATGFTDERTEKPAKNQSVGRLVYTDKAIYIGLHLYDDMPDKIVARQTKDQTRFQGEDWVSFSLDPFHTHQFSDRSFFIVNPLGTKYAHLATGRAEKSEWIGLWKTAAQIVDDGWIVEMEIPWQMLDYPDTKKPIRMGINIDRGQQRTGEKSWWCNLGVNEFRENDGHWIDVLPPPRKRELKLLPYLIGGINETEAEKREYSARLGGDIRYEVTPQVRLIGTANPDFANIEQAVEGIDFSYGERYVPDRRPFFSEGGNAYYLDSFFHSRRIDEMDGGLKLFGKVAKNTSVSTLGTYHRNNQNFILRVAQGLTATSNINGAFLSNLQLDTEANNVGYFWGNVRHNKFAAFAHIAQGWEGNSDGRNGYAKVGYEGQYLNTAISAFFLDPDFVNRLGYHPFKDYRGVELNSFFRNEWREGFIRSVSLAGRAQASNTYDDEVFRRNLSISSRILTHSDYSVSATWHGGQFEEFTDSVFGIRLGARASDRFNNVSVSYTWGEQADERIHRISGNLNLRAYGFTAGLISQVQWRLGRLYQHIFTLTYDFNPALSLGSRLIWRSEHVNVYFALRRSGYAGMDFFIILGEPNALEFKQRLVAKVIRAF